MTASPPPQRTPVQLPDLPPELHVALAAHGVPAAALSPHVTAVRRRPVSRLTGSGLVVDLALDDRGRRLNLLEVHGRTWARARGLPTPDVLAHDGAGRWLLARQLDIQPASGHDYVHAASALAARIAGSSPPRGGPPPTSWRAPRRTIVLRAARMRAAGMSLTSFRAVRRAASALPTGPVAHNDYTYRNVLHLAAGGLCLVDWEYLGPAPRYTDELRLWTTLRREDDRQLLMELLLRRADKGQRSHIGLLSLWLSLRLRAENVAAPRPDRDPADAAHAAEVLVEAKRIARELGGWSGR